MVKRIIWTNTAKKTRTEILHIGLNITDHLSIQKIIKITKTKGRTSAIRTLLW